MENGILEVFSTAGWILAFTGISMLVIMILGLVYKKRVFDADDLVVAGRKLNFFSCCTACS